MQKVGGGAPEGIERAANPSDGAAKTLLCIRWAVKRDDWFGWAAADGKLQSVGGPAAPPGDSEASAAWKRC